MSAVDITLINAAPGVAWHDKGYLLKPPPLGVLSLAGWLRARGLSAQVLDYQLEEVPVEDQLKPYRFVAFMEAAAQAATLGISVMGGMLPVVLLAVEEYKRRHPEHRIILGGSGPSGVAVELLRRFPSVDVVVCGEGEETLEQLLLRPFDPGSVAGLVYRDGSEIRRTSNRPRIQNLDGLTMPAYDLIDMGRYAVANVSTSRGCPYHCAFCESPAFWGRGVTRRNLRKVVDEMRALHDIWGKRQINLCDDTFVVDRQRVLAFCDLLDAEGFDVRWECFGRVDLVDESLMRRMAASGCTAVFFGIESGSDRVLRAIHKRFTVDRAREVVAQAVDIFKSVYTSFVWGFPFETLDDFFDSVMLMAEFAQLGARIQRPYLSLRAGSPMFERYREKFAFSSRLPLHFLEVPRHHIPEEVENLVRDNPSIFPPFFHVDSDGFEEKRQFMERLESLGKDRWRILSEHLARVIGQAEKENRLRESLST